MQGLYDFLRYLDAAAFAGLGFVTFRQWLVRRDEASRWTVLTFASLGVVAVVGEFLLPEDPEGTFARIVEKLVVAVLLMFPYFLFRIATSFSERPTRAIDLGAAVLTGILVVWSLLLGDFPGPGEERTSAFNAFVFALLVQWVLLSAFVAVRFWRAGTDQPDVARRRMRMLSIASTIMSVAIVVSGTASGEEELGLQITIQLIAMASVISFYLAFSPPAWLRAVWRREAQAEVRKAAMSVLTSGSPEDVVEAVLPHAAAVVGGRGIAVFDSEGGLLGSHGFSSEELAALDPVSNVEAVQHVKLEYPFGSLIVRTTRHTPFFGADDISLLGALGALLNLALQRIEAIDVERRLAEAKLRRRQALEINDNIVQKLAVAHYAFVLGRDDEGKKATEDALQAARKTISDLLGELTQEPDLGTSPLTRQAPASEGGRTN